MKSISIIGSGLGGLSAAARLAHAGYDVTVYEKNSSPGGKAGSFTLDGCRFDSGPSLLTMPFVINELFESVNEITDRWLKINKLSNLCRYFYPDGTILNAYPDAEKLAEEIEKNTDEKSTALYRYLEYCRTIYELTADIFLFSDLYSIKTYMSLKALKTLLKLPKIDSFRTMNEANSSFFKDERIIQLFNRYATYNGSNPYMAPATLNIISHVEYNMGGYYVSGGMHNLTDALYRLAVKKGVKFSFNSEVSKITLMGKTVKGILVDGNEIPCDAVISNADVYQTYSRLLCDAVSKPAEKFSRLEASSSAIVFYWKVKINSDNLQIHNILFSSDYRKEFEELFEKKIIPADPTVYIYISSKFSPGDAPAGTENWFVMINAPNSANSISNTPISNENIKQIILSKIKSLTGCDITNNILAESVMTPEDIETQTGSFGGSIYGISSNSRKAAFLRQSNRSDYYKGLYFTGGSAHPGGGIPLVILSGKIAAGKIISKHRQKS